MLLKGMGENIHKALSQWKKNENDVLEKQKEIIQ